MADDNLSGWLATTGNSQRKFERWQRDAMTIVDNYSSSSRIDSSTFTKNSIVSSAT